MKSPLLFWIWLCWCFSNHIHHHVISEWLLFEFVINHHFQHDIDDKERWTQQIVLSLIKSVQNNVHLMMILFTLSMLPNKPLLNHLFSWIVIWMIKTNPHCCFILIIISEKNHCSCSFHLTLSHNSFNNAFNTPPVKETDWYTLIWNHLH